MSRENALLCEYVRDRSEPAFAELVRRHLDLVYATALRETGGDSSLAEDISQGVFLELARKAPRLLDHPTLAGWLYTCVRLVAANARRAEWRRHRREQEALSMNAPSEAGGTEPSWEEIRPVLDDAMHALSEADRTAVVLRFFQDLSLRQVGDTLGLSENAARMRVDRALDRLRAQLGCRGITSTADGLAAAMAQGVMIQAPAELAATMTVSILTGTAAAGSVPLTALKIMTLTKLKAGLVGTLMVAVVAVPAWQQSRINRLTRENVRLQATAAEAAAGIRRLPEVSPASATADELSQLREDHRRMQAELARLRGMAGVARRAEAETAQLRMQLMQQQAAQTSGESSDGGAIGDLMQAAMTQQSEGQVLRMRTKLQLTPEQTDAVRAITERQMQQASRTMQKVFSGKLGQKDVAELRQGHTDPEGEIRALLSPEQLTLYDEYKQEEAQSQARLGANAELLQLQNALGLSTDQQDEVFGILYDQTLRQLQGQAEVKPGNDPVEVMVQFVEQKAKALADVLTPDQIQIYRRQQEAQVLFLRGILSPAGEAANSD